MSTVKSIGVLSVAKMIGAIHAILGLFALPFFLLVGLMGTMAPNQHGQNPFGPIFGLIFGILAPVFYGVFGFIVGAIGALLYNLMAKWIGGIEVRIESPAAVAPASSIVT